VPKGLRAAHTTRILEHIRHHPAQNQRALARACGLTEGVTRKHIAVLLESGAIRATPPDYAPRYVARAAPNDERQINVKTTPARPAT
jgi:DNA-binding MarR family transcriptional regulator